MTICTNQFLDKALKEDGYDKMLQYYKAMVLYEQDKVIPAMICMSALASHFPNKALYNLGYFVLYYNAGCGQEAVPYMVKALKLAPQIMESSLWKVLRKKDSQISQMVIRCVVESLQKGQDCVDVLDPIRLSKYACLLLFVGEYEAASCIFNHAITIMPNLAYPWYYLYAIDEQQKKGDGDILLLKRFLYLNFNIPVSEMDHINRQQVLDMLKTREFTNNNYPLKFSNWYKSTTLKTEFIF